MTAKLHEASEAGRFDEVLACYRPQDVENWKAKQLELWDLAAAIGQGESYARLFPGYSRDEVAELDAKTALKTSLAAIRADWLTRARPPGDFRLLGIIREDDVTHVAVLRRGEFELQPCYKTANGEFALGIGAIADAKLRTKLMIAKLQAEKVPPSEFEERMGKSAVPVEAKILGIVSDGEDQIWVVGRGKFRDEAGQEYDIVGVTPVSERHPLRRLLDPDDPTKLDDERRAKIEEAFWNSEKQASSGKEGSER